MRQVVAQAGRLVQCQRVRVPLHMFWVLGREVGLGSVSLWLVGLVKGKG